MQFARICFEAVCKNGENYWDSLCFAGNNSFIVQISCHFALNGHGCFTRCVGKILRFVCIYDRTGRVYQQWATSARLPPCAPTPGTNRKWLGACLRISRNIFPWVAPTTYIICSSVAQSCDFFNTFSNSRSPFASSVNWKSCEPLLEVSASRITHASG